VVELPIPVHGRARSGPVRVQARARGRRDQQAGGEERSERAHPHQGAVPDGEDAGNSAAPAPSRGGPPGMPTGTPSPSENGRPSSRSPSTRTPRISPPEAGTTTSTSISARSFFARSPSALSRLKEAREEPEAPRSLRRRAGELSNRT